MFQPYGDEDDNQLVEHLDNIIHQEAGRTELLQVGVEIRGNKSQKIRWLLEAGFTKTEIAKALNVQYQMVYQVEQKMGEQYRREFSQPQEQRYYWER